MPTKPLLEYAQQINPSMLDQEIDGVRYGDILADMWMLKKKKSRISRKFLYWDEDNQTWIEDIQEATIFNSAEMRAFEEIRGKTDEFKRTFFEKFDLAIEVP